MRKAIVVLVAVIFFPAIASAQVSCSVGVKAEMCKELANAFDVLGKGIVAVAKKSIPLELVTAKEYKERMDAMHKAEDDGDVQCALKEMRAIEKMDRRREARPEKVINCFSNQEPHALYNPLTEDIAFLRDTTETALPDRILISSDALERVSVSVDRKKVAVKPNGHFDSEMLFVKVNYILGYIVGCYSQQRLSQSALLG